jgi:ribosomal protein S12 methylthiotransferase accessory factor
MGVGYGATDELAALSALGETVETRWAAESVPRLERVRGTYAALRGRALDPRELLLPAGTDVHEDRELEWVTARRWRTGEEVLVPVEAVATEPGELGPTAPPPLFPPVTNGLGAGDTVERAVLHGILEAVQRDGNVVAHRALDLGVGVDLTGHDHPVLRRLEDLGIDVVVKSCYSDLGIANVVAVGAERDPAQAPYPLCVTGAGEAAHPDRGHAIAKALLEFCSSRARKPFSFGPLEDIAPMTPERYLEYAATVDPAAQEPRALDALLDWLSLDAAALRDEIADPVLSVRRTIGLDELPHTDVPADVGAVLDVVLDRLAGFDVLWVDLSPPGGAVRVTKAIVPGLESETASYGRIGPRNFARLLERDLGLVGHGAPPEGAQPIPFADPEHAPGWLHRARLDELVGGLYALYREPARHATSVLAGQRQRA